jgi:predicted ATP-grasp superfamily ATP-dependent carboligase
VDNAAPLLIAAFEGWNDAANAASDALRFLIRSLSAQEVHALDFEQYFDFQAARPQVEIVDGVVRNIGWPATRVYRAEIAGRALVLALGVEPNLHWPAFCAEILRVATEQGVTTAVTLGALLGDTPHTRPIAITGTASDPRAAARLGLQRSRYEGPTGIVGVLADQARRTGLVSVSLWAPVPHYVATPPNPKATLALLERLGALVDVEFDLRNLGVAARAWQEQVDSVALEDEELIDYVHSLEARYDSGIADEIDVVAEEDADVITFDDDLDDWDEGEWDSDEDWDEDDDEEDDDDEPAPGATPPTGAGLAEGDLPTGDALAADFERYLRDQRPDDD